MNRRKKSSISNFRKNPSSPQIQFTPKENFSLSMDMKVDFQFIKKQEQQIQYKNITSLLTDIYPYYNLNSITSIFIILTIFHRLSYTLSQQINQIQQILYNNNNSNHKMYQQLSILFVYINYLLIIGSYFESHYQSFYIIMFIITYFVGYINAIVNYKSTYLMANYHVFYSTYSLYAFILIQSKIKNINQIKFIDINQIKSFGQKVKHFSCQIYLNHIITTIKEKINDYKFNRQENNINQISQRQLSIKYNHNESFTYEQFFTYFQQKNNQNISYNYNEGSIMKNIGTDNINLSTTHNIKSINDININNINNINNNFSDFLTIKPMEHNNRASSIHSFSHKSKVSSSLFSSQLQQYIDQQTQTNTKNEQQKQIIKIYKLIILSFLIYTTSNKIQWISYLVSVVMIFVIVEIIFKQNQIAQCNKWGKVAGLIGGCCCIIVVLIVFG